ncbi:MAG: hypothetical protein JW760_10785, partial [Spirochaetales bacterium]|nr:hypothetical protein [Spirochaetales bacterium]
MVSRSRWMILFLLIAQLSFADDILEKTLPLDIKTSNYYELVAWCERLGIESSGTRKELESKLLAFYNIDIEDRQNEPEGESRITIQSAAGLDYFTLDVMEESYIRLSGGVVLVLEDKKEEGTHEIKADSIVFNQDQHSLTASGNIEYVLTRNGTSEVFRGDSLTFDTDSWEGVFFQGVSERERSTEEKVITFYYSGDSIFRTEDNVVTLDKGTITSSERLPPNYSIKASKIWVLAPGEWAIQNAVLYLGYVPIFYFPAFFRPGDPLFFHPSLGYKQREGYFVQTTTYMLGTQPIDDEDTTISFLQTVGTEDVERSIEGLFLRETNRLSPFQKNTRSFADKTGSYFKLLVDVYSRLGFLTALEGELKDLGILKSFSL